MNGYFLLPSGGRPEPTLFVERVMMDDILRCMALAVAEESSAAMVREG